MAQTLSVTYREKKYDLGILSLLDPHSIKREKTFKAPQKTQLIQCEQDACKVWGRSLAGD